MKKVILLVEDNPDDGELTLRAMCNQRTDTVVVNTCDGNEALNFLFGTGEHKGRFFSTTPHLILLDLKLPTLSGLEVLKRIRKDARSRALPVVMLTSSSQEQDILDAYCSGANGYIRKQVDYTQFRKDIRQALDYWLNLNQMPPASAA